MGVHNSFIAIVIFCVFSLHFFVSGFVIKKHNRNWKMVMVESRRKLGKFSIVSEKEELQWELKMS